MLANSSFFRGSPLLKIVLSTSICLLVLNFSFFGPSLRPFMTDVPNTFTTYPNSSTATLTPVTSPDSPSSSTQLTCAQLKGADDVLVVMKTGSTELADKLPIHLNTTLLCYPHSLIFSDHAETLSNHTIHDALANVSEAIKATHDDFALYRRLQYNNGRANLTAAELSGSQGVNAGGKGGKVDNPGWRLDKWKFLPMMAQTLRMEPERKWYVFVETDTYVVWSNLLAWLAEFDAEKNVYAGYQMQIGGQVFAYGGSGFVVSNSALRAVVDLVAKNVTAWEDYTAGHWAGDCVLGRAFEEAGTMLKWSWPLTQGDKPSAMNPFKVAYGRRNWCSPVVSYHHLAVDEVERMWRFEQEWTAEVRMFLKCFCGDGDGVTDLLVQKRPLMRQSDIYNALILPSLVPERRDWDNLSELSDLDPEDSDPEPQTLAQCREICRAQDKCLQYRLTGTKCTTATEMKLGSATAPVSGEREKEEEGEVVREVHSGWVVERIERTVREAETCDYAAEGWIV